jgi:hypothetical protein
MPARPAAIGYPRPATAAVAVRGGTAPAVSGDGTTHGEWTRNAKAIIDALAAVKVFQDRMLADLARRDASESQIRDVGLWSDHVTAFRQMILGDLAATDARLRPYIDAIMAAGGYREVADPAYHADY